MDFQAWFNHHWANHNLSYIGPPNNYKSLAKEAWRASRENLGPCSMCNNQQPALKCEKCGFVWDVEDK